MKTLVSRVDLCLYNLSVSFMLKSQHWSRYLLLYTLGVSIVTIQIFVTPAQALKEIHHNQAQSLTERGHELLNQGHASEAVEIWDQALKIYQQLRYEEGITGTLINKSLGLQYLGLYPRACNTLLQALKLDRDASVCATSLEPSTDPVSTIRLLTKTINEQKSTQVYLLGLRNLGDVLRLLGKPDTSYAILNKTYEIANRLPLKSENLNNELLLSLANTEQALYYQAKNKYQLTDEPESKQIAIEKARLRLESALRIYQQLRSIEKQNPIALQSELNQLSLFIEAEKWADLKRKSTQLITTTQSLQELVKTILIEKSYFQNLSSIESVYARLHFVQSLIQINQNRNLKQLLLPNDNSLFTSLSIAKEALLLAQELKNKRAESQALGVIGNIYGYLGRASESKQYLETAMGLAQSVQAWDVAYQWQWRLGRLYHQTGEIDKALESYASAINSLSQVRGSILAANREIQLGFKEKVEPVYQEYMELLLSQSRPNLKQVVAAQEKLKIAELETFLQCSQLPIISLNNSQKATKLPPTIYLIKLKDRVEVIVRTPQDIFYRHTLELTAVSDNINSLITAAQSQDFAEIRKSNLLIHAQAIYNLLFVPIKKYLPDSGTLVFVVDTYFQNLPLAMLNDGKNFLISHYSISTASSSELWESQTLKPLQPLKALIAGLYEVSPSLKNSLVPKNFQALPEVKTEIAGIKENTAPSSVLLLNSKFTSDNLHQKMEKNLFKIVHISTHGQFSSDSEKTFLLAWDVPITVKQLKFLLKIERSGIDLLVLSACQTAKGDKRSTLGIAGIAAQAGAKSTVASLWLVEAGSTAQLMSEFYKGLENGMTKAEALRQAQLKLMSNPAYSHPYFWAGFILVGNWL
ncbi:CHAT domain-containing protein [Nostoc sp. CCY0012]|uniref:CHAT domain-containing protein n=1 Tax=Nostoc sp. CCY0012 TaxID=1056123 RepID=UPI0039C64410